ncbi:MAG: hypothetical protein KDD70_09345, partial [Bdellovibrionales bacterium]|nr:hypothetical protein [Bdellovibrionales bacterium]
FELEVFREILNNFVKDATVEGENRFQRQGSVYYSTPDDTERRILLQSDYYSPAGKDGSRADWPIVAVRLVDGGSSMSPESRALMLVGEPAVEVVRKIKAAHDIEALKYQIEDQLEALTLKGAAEPHVLVKGRNGFERIVIEGLNSDLAAYEAVEHLEDHMTGLAFRIFDYQKENDPLSLPRWGIEVTRRRAA